MCDPSQSIAYNDDMRWYIVWQKEVPKLPDKEVATNLCVSLSTVQRVVTQFRIKGAVSK